MSIPKCLGPFHLLGLLILVLALNGCLPQLTGQTLYLYASKAQGHSFSDVTAYAGKYARKYRAKLKAHSLAEFRSRALGDILSPLQAGDALALVLYHDEYNDALEARLQQIQPILGKRQIRLGVWLLTPSKAKAKPVPSSLKGLTGAHFDAISSASATAPGKTNAKIFFPPLVQPRSSNTSGANN